MSDYISVFDLLIVIAGVYMIFWGISGKGSIYKTDNIKTNCVEKYKKIIKWFCLVGGALAVAMGALEHFKVEPLATILFYSLCAVVVAAFLVVLFFTDPNKQHDRHLL